MSSFDEYTLDLSQRIEVRSSVGDAYRAMIRRLTDENSTPDNRPLPMVLELWPGGRWFRDLGQGQGHLWGFVQVIKPPTLLEIHGPMFMSYAAAGHLQLRLTQISGGVEVSVRHRVFGMIDEEHRRDAVPGWNNLLQQIKQLSEQGRS